MPCPRLAGAAAHTLQNYFKETFTFHVLYVLAILPYDQTQDHAPKECYLNMYLYNIYTLMISIHVRT